LREIHPKWKKLAVFGHFENRGPRCREAGTDTVIVRLENKMVLDHPGLGAKTSVGIVV